ATALSNPSQSSASASLLRRTTTAVCDPPAMAYSVLAYRPVVIRLSGWQQVGPVGLSGAARWKGSSKR
ncbi:MAG: hypothetical protein J2O39_08320, partial [Acidimicrobiales bacterium]|nr:hypothetical protein [Acidimicrobiales bacterium]